MASSVQELRPSRQYCEAPIQCTSTDVVFGGGSRKRYFDAPELRDVKNQMNLTPNVDHPRYDLHSYVSAHNVAAELNSNPGSIACLITLKDIVDKLDRDELRDLCTLHSIDTHGLYLRDSFMERLQNHGCKEGCEECFTVLVPSKDLPRSMTSGLLDIESSDFTKTCKTIPAMDLQALEFGDELENCKGDWKLTKVSCQPVIATDDSELVVDSDRWPLSHLVNYFSTTGIRSIAAVHRLQIPVRWSKDDCLWFVGKHTCVTCPALRFVLTGTTKKARCKMKEKREENEKFSWEEYEAKSLERYPPAPITHNEIRKMMKGFCDELTPELVEESGCAVCGQLHRRSDMKRLEDLEEYTHVLHNCEATRTERQSIDEPIQAIPGAVLLEQATLVCPPCNDALIRGSRPKFALANSLWLGNVPEVLKDLTLAEKALISRVRYNRCVVRVASGHIKMVANVIAFEHPTLKIYNQLPMSKNDLEEVLAVVFTGVAAPTTDDLKRTPVLVRKERVKNALEWLRLNNSAYADLTIDYETLETYPLEGVPVGVLHQKREAEGNIEPAATSQFDDEEEQGTESGPCPFTVNGLTANHFAKMTTAQRKAGALQHLKNGGSLLAVGHDPTPQSIYDNPGLYPAMFPWLFPYGLGGVGQETHKGFISRERHVKWLLLYGDKRFQEDAGFVIVAFNHTLIRQSTTGSFMLIKRNNFSKVADTVQRISPYVLSNIAEKMKEGGKFVPQTRDEKDCFSLLDQIEYVGGQVDGSLASKKWMRNELWSLVSFKNAPHWFLTLSPADSKHPLCVYMASHDVTFSPEIKGYEERQLLVTGNPVACARFFDYVIKLFIKHICGWTGDEPQRAMFGKPSAYYGTVEQQGRMTLHLHHLLWIEGSLPPQVIRDRLLSGDSEFQRELIAYLDSCRVGEFLTGSMADLSERVPKVPEHSRPKGIHTILTDENTRQVPKGYKDPTLTMPKGPDVPCCDRDECSPEECPNHESWWESFKKVVDDIVFRSNVHRCFGRRDNAAKPMDSLAASTKTRIPKQHTTGKGCINKDGVCTARFPREIFETTNVDGKTGHVNLKKHEAWINDITPLISATFRCNTDTTCLLSGTAVKATLGYITDYITKGWLKTHQIFSIMYDTFTRTPQSTAVEDTKPGAAARRMILKIVNSLSAKMEIGAPMAALYLLGNPDHYTSHDFRVFYWKNYVNFVEEEWRRYLAVADPEQLPNVPEPPSSSSDVGITRTAVDNAQVKDLVKEETSDTLLIQKSNKQYVGKATTDDYRHRPNEHSRICLYEWIQCSVKQYEQSTRAPKKTLQFFPYQAEHPQHESHLVACDLDRRHYTVPNFVGPALPKRDSSDREHYCCTMLTLFRPWRTGVDLKAVDESWEQAFDRNSFSPRQQELMVNFNLRYECYDARDDYPRLMKASSRDDDEDDLDSERDIVDPECYEDLIDDDQEDITFQSGPKTREMESINQQTTEALRMAGWAVSKSKRGIDTFQLPKVVIDKNFNATVWRAIVRSEKNKIWQAKFKAAELGNQAKTGDGVVRNDVRVVPGSYITQGFIPEKPEWSAIIHDIAGTFSLNVEQRKAFNIVANHATCIGPEQLLMHLGGMGGTGKSQVIRSLEAYFEKRGEPYRLVLLGPTGTSAALIGGSTYHSFLGLRTGKETGGSPSSLDEVLERLIRCGYLFIDECSMLGCRDLCHISARICEVLEVYEKPFGGLNVILAGDFAQLPPAKGSSLYSRSVSLHQTPRQTLGEQEATIGRMIWLQFTKVVILKQNMRQTGEEPEEQAFRNALVNLRYYNCTPEDIVLIRSRIANDDNGLSLNNPPFKNVSIITARNRVKDQINECNVQRFATETRQSVAEFYSVDKLSQADPKNRNKDRVYAQIGHLTKGLKNVLWDQPPHTSEQVPACLKLCLGMPIIIRYNEATELCITRGQEARVLGWTSSNVSSSDHRQVLDVLYAELVNPPKKVKLPNLPLNVIPLTKMSQSIEARLPTDAYVCIARNQVPCLPNFAMTDYSSQGKTREANVIDIKESRNFQAAYTSLSRGTTLAGTVLVRDFDDDLLTGTLDGEIRQEYRELDMLDIITDLQYQGVLPVDFGDGTRWGTIMRYKERMGISGEDDDEVVIEHKGKKKGKVKALVKIKDIKYEIHTLAEQHKRKREKLPHTPKKKRRVTRGTLINNAPMLAPVGPIWDSVDHSCAYDSCFFVLYWLWFSNTRRWGRVLTDYGPVSAALLAAFSVVGQTDLEGGMVAARNQWRTAIRDIYPGEYPAGDEGVDMLELGRRMCQVRRSVRNNTLVCMSCERVTVLRSAARHSLGRFNICGRVGSVQDWVNTAVVPVGVCDHCGGDLQGSGVHEEVLLFDLHSERGDSIDIEPELTTIDTDRYFLVGVIYHGGYHFVSRLVTSERKVFFHDGIHGAFSTLEGTLHDDFAPARLSLCGFKTPTLALYAKE